MTDPFQEDTGGIGNSGSGNASARTNPEPVTVTIEPFSEQDKSYKAKHYRLDCCRYRLEQQSYAVGRRSLIALGIYTGVTIILAFASILATYYAKKSSDLTRDLVKDTYAADINVVMGFEGHSRNGIVENTANVGFENRGKHATVNHVHYKMWIETPQGKTIRSVKEFSFEDNVPPVGRAPMPNHFVSIDPFSQDDLTAYQNALEVIKAEGTFSYDDGFGTTITNHFCVATTHFASLTCDAVDRYVRSLQVTQ